MLEFEFLESGSSSRPVGATAFAPGAARQTLAALTLTALTLIGWSGARAVQAASAPDAAQAPSAPAEAAPAAGGESPLTLQANYKLGPGDLLSIRVARHPELDTPALVLDDGSINVTRAGRLNVVGMTLAEAQDAIRKKLTSVLVNPSVSVAIVGQRIEQVFVTGAVNAPGPVAYKEGWRVAQAISKAGGLKIPASWVDATLTQNGGETVKLNMEKVLQKPGGPDDLPLHPGDTLIVTEIQPQEIFVGGEVIKAGMYDIRDVDPRRGCIGVVEALSMAGGATPKAALSQAYILRANHTGADGGITSAASTAASPSLNARRREPINLAMLERDRVPNTNPSTAAASAVDEKVLYPGDTLFIPESTAKVFVMGMVKTPGAYDIPDGKPTSLAEALALAGGPDKRAKLNQVGVIRPPDPSKGQTGPTLLKANVSDLMGAKSDLRQNIMLQPGDIVVVAETSKPDWFGKLIPASTGLAQMLYLGGLTKVR